MSPWAMDLLCKTLRSVFQVAGVQNPMYRSSVHAAQQGGMEEKLKLAVIRAAGSFPVFRAHYVRVGAQFAAFLSSISSFVSADKPTLRQAQLMLPYMYQNKKKRKRRADECGRQIRKRETVKRKASKGREKVFPLVAVFATGQGR